MAGLFGFWLATSQGFAYLGQIRARYLHHTNHALQMDLRVTLGFAIVPFGLHILAAMAGKIFKHIHQAIARFLPICQRGFCILYHVLCIKRTLLGIQEILRWFCLRLTRIEYAIFFRCVLQY